MIDRFPPNISAHQDKDRPGGSLSRYSVVKVLASVHNGVKLETPTRKLWAPSKSQVQNTKGRSGDRGRWSGTSGPNPFSIFPLERARVRRPAAISKDARVSKAAGAERV